MRTCYLTMIAVLGVAACDQELLVTTGDEGVGGEGGAGGESCAGQCVPKEPLGWSDPALLWYGPPELAPECPSSAPLLGSEGHANLSLLPGVCGKCVCEPPVGTLCELPIDWAAANTPMCPSGPGAQVTTFAAPAGWNGQCTAVNAIPAGQSCGGTPCVQSLAIDAPVVVPGACTPKVEEPPGLGDSAWPWATLAKACVGTAYPSCTDAASTCAPVPPEDVGGTPPEGFLTCVYREGERDCPRQYPNRVVFYEGTVDTRTCTACACGDPQGASCSVMASAFSDGQCTAQVVAVGVSSAAPFCGSISPGSGLGSKSMALTGIDPGMCVPSGGEPVGGVMPSEPSTFCCLPSAP